MRGSGRALWPALAPRRPQRPAALEKKSLAGNSRHLDGARSALLVTRWICCEDGLKRSKGNMHIEQVSAYFCPPSRGGSPCAALPAGGQARKQKKYEKQEEDNADNENHGGTALTTRTTNEDHERGPRRARRARRARDAEGARHEHEHEHEHGTSTSTSTSTGTSTGTSTSTSTNDSST